MDSPGHMWKEGDRVTWDCAITRDQRVPIPGVVLTVTASRVTIRAAFQIFGEWVIRRRSVTAEKLSPRTTAVAALGEKE